MFLNVDIVLLLIMDILMSDYIGYAGIKLIKSNHL